MWEVSRTRALCGRLECCPRPNTRASTIPHAAERAAHLTARQTTQTVRLHVVRRSLDVTSHPGHARSDGSPSLTSSRTAH
jgi:hypothetical protein